MIALSALAALALLIAPAPSAAQCQPYGTLAFRSPVAAAPGLVATALVANLTLPRGIALDRRGTVLVIERGLGVSALTENDPSCAGWLRTLVVANANLTQGIQVHGTDLYVSTPGEVLRYAYDATTRTVAGVPVVIVTGIPPDGGEQRGPSLHPIRADRLCRVGDAADPPAPEKESNGDHRLVSCVPIPLLPP